MAMTLMSGFCSLRNLPVPISVPLVPRPATKWVISGQSRQISGPVPVVVRLRVVVVAVLVEEAPLGVLRGHDLRTLDRTVAALFAGGEDDLGAEHLQHLAALDGHAGGHEDLDRVAAHLGDGASAIPVLPDDGSMMVWPGCSMPSASACRIIWRAMRSFTEPNGFWLSSLAMMRTFGFGDSTLTSTIGVLPMRSSTLLLHCWSPCPHAFRNAPGGLFRPGRSVILRSADGDRQFGDGTVDDAVAARLGGLALEATRSRTASSDPVPGRRRWGWGTARCACGCGTRR
jgi:hypothetical protein